MKENPRWVADRGIYYNTEVENSWLSASPRIIVISCHAAFKSLQSFRNNMNGRIASELIAKKLKPQ